jgi:hypothetical protein
MQNPHQSIDYNSLLTFLGGLLSFLAFIGNIVYRKLRKTEDVAAKLLGGASILLPVLAGCGKIVLGERFFALVASFRQS